MFSVSPLSKFRALFRILPNCLIIGSDSNSVVLSVIFDVELVGLLEVELVGLSEVELVGLSDVELVGSPEVSPVRFETCK
jgi:hypothetical protein